MRTLVIKDLLLDEELDREAMANVRGGMPDLPRDPRTIGYLGTAPWLMNS
jgi:hypothetical protein